MSKGGEGILNWVSSSIPRFQRLAFMNIPSPRFCIATGSCFPHVSGVRRLVAFTLVEMLVVIAIVGIVAALIFPTLSASRRAAQNVGCVNNLRKMGVGLSAYVADHDGALIPGAHTQELPKIIAWYRVLNDYVGGEEFTKTSSPAIWLCPSKILTPMNTTTSAYIGYGWNYSSFGDLVGSVSLGWGSKMAQVTKPSRTIIIGDSKDPWINPGATPQNYYLYRPPSVNLATRHSGNGNYLMLDGHVEALPPTMDSTYFLKVQ